MQNKKSIFIIVAMVVILAIGTGAYYFLPKDNKKASISNITLSGDTWSQGIYTGKPLTIKWNSLNVNSVNIDLLNTQTSAIRSIVKNIKNTGTYEWEPEDIAAWRGYDAQSKISVSAADKGLNVKAESSIFGMGQPGPAGGLENNLKTYTGYGISFEYPSNWTYQQFNCNLEGVAFCPAKAGVTGCGQTCGMDSPTSPMYFYASATVSKNNLQLKDNNYRNIYNQMLSTFKFTTPTDQTAGWKKYTDQNYNYTIKYPATWYLEKNSYPNGTVYGLTFSNYSKEVESNPPKDLYLFGLNVTEINPQTTYNDILEGFRPYKDTEQQNVEIDGVKSIKLTKTTDEHLIKSLETFKSTNVYIFTKTGANLFTFLYSSENPYTGEKVAQDKIDMAEKIISTFKFTK